MQTHQEYKVDLKFKNPMPVPEEHVDNYNDFLLAQEGQKSSQNA